MAKRAHVPPSRERYYQAHPVVSFRASQEDYAALKKTLGTSGKSIGQFFREALGTARRDTRIAYEKGRRDGYRKAKKEYRVIVGCKLCGGPILVKGDVMKMKVSDAVAKVYDWYHKECKPSELAEDECELFDRETEDE
jgi:hypothetical protein